MICTRFAKSGDSPYLTDELADALQEAGAEVSVAVLDWSAAAAKPTRLFRANGLEAVFVPPARFHYMRPRVEAGLRWALSSLFAIPAFHRAFGKKRFDLVVAFSPMVVSGFAIVWAKMAFRCRAFAYITDFFPWHWASAGQIGRLTERAGLVLETFLMRRFDTVACMSPAGVRFLEDHYTLRSTIETPVLPLWGPTDLVEVEDRAAVRRRFLLPEDRPIVVFGGQISEGRGIEDILAAATLAAERPDGTILFLFVGAGRLEPLIRDCGLPNVEWRPPVERDAYLSFVAACDIGLVSTIAGTGVPTFPSKTIDYLRAGLPIVASVETTTDYRAFVNENGFGLVVDAGDPPALLAAIVSLMAAPERRFAMADAGRRALRRHFDVGTAARRVLAQSDGKAGLGVIRDGEPCIGGDDRETSGGIGGRG